MLVSGFCPVQKTNYTIEVTYLNAPSLDKGQLVKGHYQCNYDLFGDECSEATCPLYENAPKYK